MSAHQPFFARNDAHSQHRDLVVGLGPRLDGTHEQDGTVTAIAAPELAHVLTRYLPLRVRQPIARLLVEPSENHIPLARSALVVLPHETDDGLHMPAHHASPVAPLLRNLSELLERWRDARAVENESEEEGVGESVRNAGIGEKGYFDEAVGVAREALGVGEDELTDLERGSEVVVEFGADDGERCVPCEVEENAFEVRSELQCEALWTIMSATRTNRGARRTFLAQERVCTWSLPSLQAPAR